MKCFICSRRIFIAITFILLSTRTIAQYEKVLVYVDKCIGFPGDSIWMRMFLYDSTSETSALVKVEIWNDNNQRITSTNFACTTGFGLGQLAFPESAGMYYLRGYTSSSAKEVILPITVLENATHPQIKTLVEQDRILEEKILNITIKHVEGNKWSINVPDSILGNYAISVTNVNCPFVDYAYQQHSEFNNQFWKNTSGNYVKANYDKKFAGQEVVFYTASDSGITTPHLFKLDTSGVITIFCWNFKPLSIGLKLNKKSKNIKGNLNFQPIIESDLHFELSSDLHFKEKIIDLFRDQSVLDPFTGGRKLATVTVKSNWRDRNLALASRYVKGDQFKAVEHDYDLRDNNLVKYPIRVYEYLEKNAPPKWYVSLLWQLGYCREGVRCFEDEKSVIREVFMNEPITKYAYLKVYTDLYDGCPAVCAWTRKGVDLGGLPTEIQFLNMPSFQRFIDWTTPDRLTYHWNGFVNSATYQFEIPAKQFAVHILGMSRDGKILRFDKIIGLN